MLFESLNISLIRFIKLTRNKLLHFIIGLTSLGSFFNILFNKIVRIVPMALFVMIQVGWIQLKIFYGIIGKYGTCITYGGFRNFNLTSECLRRKNWSLWNWNDSFLETHALKSCFFPLNDIWVQWDFFVFVDLSVKWVGNVLFLIAIIIHIFNSFSSDPIYMPFFYFYRCLIIILWTTPRYNLTKFQCWISWKSFVM